MDNISGSDFVPILIDTDIIDDRHSYLLEKIGKIPRVNKENYIGVILVIPIYYSQQLIKKIKGIDRVTYINNIDFVNNIIASCYIYYNKNKKVCDILNPSIFILSYVLESALTNLPSNILIYTRFDITDNDSINNAISFGFKNPYICSNGLSDNKYDICMYKKNEYTIDKIDNKTIQNEVYYVLQNFNEEICKLVVKFDKKTVLYLKKLCMMGNTPNKDDTISQKEISGSLTLIPDNSFFIVHVNKDSIDHGDEEGVSVTKSIYNFHTHPKEAYERHSVTNGWPSSQDYIGFLDAVKHFKTIFHLVITLEGIYIISIGKDLVKEDIHNLNVDSFVLKRYNFFKNKMSIETYIEKINNIKYKNKQLFAVKFINWKNIQKEQIPIFYKKTIDKVGKNCFVNDDTLKGYYTINKNDF